MPDEYDEEDVTSPATPLREPGFPLVDRTTLAAAAAFVERWLELPGTHAMLGSHVIGPIQACVAGSLQSLDRTATGPGPADSGPPTPAP